jgi:hypothetical protein
MEQKCRTWAMNKGNAVDAGGMCLIGNPRLAYDKSLGTLQERGIKRSGQISRCIHSKIVKPSQEVMGSKGNKWT